MLTKRQHATPRTLTVPIPAGVELSDEQLLAQIDSFMARLLLSDVARKQVKAGDTKKPRPLVIPTEYARQHYSPEQLRQHPLLRWAGFMATDGPAEDDREREKEYLDAYMQEKYSRYL